MFFVIYRLMVFNTVPRDDYGPYLLWLLHQPGGHLPSSPYCYRILSMVAAAPFYYLLPTIRLSNMPDTMLASAPYLKATAAVAALSLVSMVLAAVVIYRTAVDRAKLSRMEGLTAAALLFAFCWNSGFFAIDPLAILLVAAGIYVIGEPSPPPLCRTGDRLGYLQRKSRHRFRALAHHSVPGEQRGQGASALSMDSLDRSYSDLCCNHFQRRRARKRVSDGYHDLSHHARHESRG